MATKTKTKVPRSQIAAALKDAAAFYLLRNGFSVVFELGVMPWGARRADIVANKISGKIVILEVKSSVADFRTDKKWRDYLQWCDKFLFCMTEDVFEKLKDELPDEAGVICLSATTGFAYMAKRCGVHDLDDENRLSVLARIAWRQGDLSKRTHRAKRVWLGEAPDILPPKVKRAKRKGRRGGRGWQKKRASAARRLQKEETAGQRLTRALDSLLERKTK